MDPSLTASEEKKGSITLIAALQRAQAAADPVISHVSCAILIRLEKARVRP
jgi:hypothetical protein